MCRLYAAVGQIGVEGNTHISVYDLKTNQRKKVLANLEADEKEYISLAFSVDNLHLASLTGAPDFHFIFWKWDRNRIISSVRLATGSNGPFHQVKLCAPYIHSLTNLTNLN